MKRRVSIIVFNFQLVLFLLFFSWDDIIGSLLVSLLSLSLTVPTSILSPYQRTVTKKGCKLQRLFDYHFHARSAERACLVFLREF